MSKRKLVRTPKIRDHNTYLWMMTELRTLIDDALAVSTQYDWINNEDDKAFLFSLMQRDMQRIAEHAAKIREGGQNSE